MGAWWARFWVLEVPGMSGDGSNPFVCPSRGLKNPMGCVWGIFLVPFVPYRRMGVRERGGEMRFWATGARGDLFVRKKGTGWRGALPGNGDSTRKKV